MRALLLFLLLALPLGASSQPARAVEAQRAAEATAWLQQYLYLRETDGYNRAPLIDSWARANGNALGSEWCGLTQWACQRAHRLPTPVAPAGSYNWFKDPKRTYFVRGLRGSVDSIRVGHCVGIYSRSRGRIAHITRAVELVPALRKGRAPRAAFCIGGNEGSGKNAGMHRTLYPLSSIYALSNWLY